MEPTNVDNSNKMLHEKILLIAHTRLHIVNLTIGKFPHDGHLAQQLWRNLEPRVSITLLHRKNRMNRQVTIIMLHYALTNQREGMQPKSTSKRNIR